MVWVTTNGTEEIKFIIYSKSGGGKVNECNGRGINWIWSGFIYHDYCQFL